MLNWKNSPPDMVGSIGMALEMFPEPSITPVKLVIQLMGGSRFVVLKML
jgi:hypothetical protein